MNQSYTPPDLKLLNELNTLIEKEFNINSNLDSYAKTLDTTLHQLNKLTRFYLKKTLYELIQERLHEHARHLLKSTTLTCRQISKELGMCDPSYFGKWFQKTEGIRPYIFRKNYQQTILTQRIQSIQKKLQF